MAAPASCLPWDAAIIFQYVRILKWERSYAKKNDTSLWDVIKSVEKSRTVMLG